MYVDDFHIPLHRRGHELHTEASVFFRYQQPFPFPLRTPYVPANTQSAQPPTIAPHACTTCKKRGRADSSRSISLAPTPPPHALLPLPLPLPLSPLPVCDGALRGDDSAEKHRWRTQRRMARAAFARTAGLRWLPQARNADSARDSVAVATTSSTHFVFWSWWSERAYTIKARAEGGQADISQLRQERDGARRGGGRRRAREKAGLRFSRGARKLNWIRRACDPVQLRSSRSTYSE